MPNFADLILARL